VSAGRSEDGGAATSPAEAQGGAAPSSTDEGRGALAALSARLGGAAPSDLLLQALTHPSYAHEHPPATHNETLAFLGDAVLGLVVADLLVRREPGAGPGTLTIRRAEIVSTRGLVGWARELGLGACLRLGRGETEHGGRDKESVLASALEAVVAALYLGGGLGAVSSLVTRLMRAGTGLPGRDGEEPGGGRTPW
jgi:ribonuclease III